MKSPLLKYKLGFLVLSLLTLCLVGFVLLQAQSSKQDKETVEAANKIATELNEYVTDKQVIPESLADAGIKDVPSSVRYKRLSEESYKFCVNYKSASSSFDASGTVSKVVFPYAYDGYSGSYEDDSYLYISDTHSKGETCQTIKPYLYSYSSPDYYDSSYGDSTICEQDYKLVTSFAPVISVTPKSGLTDGKIEVKNYAGPGTFALDPNVKVFDYNCEPLTINDIAADNYVDLYQIDETGPVTVIVKEY